MSRPALPGSAPDSIQSSTQFEGLPSVHLVAELLAQAQAAPVATVREAYRRLEAHLKHVLETRTSIATSAQTAPVLATILASEGLISRETADAVRSIAALASTVDDAERAGFTLEFERAVTVIALIENVLKIIPDPGAPPVPAAPTGTNP